VINFVVKGEPAPKGSMRAFQNRLTRKVVVKHDNPRTESWGQTVAWSARQAMQGKPPLKGPVSVRLHFRLTRPPTVHRAAPHVKPDVDKLQRAVFDALTGIVWDDDGQVTKVMAEKEYASAEEGPLVHVIVFADDDRRPVTQERAPDGKPATRITVEDLP
jgi:crossover junction endodeoxyribonuclease RusA